MNKKYFNPIDPKYPKWLSLSLLSVLIYFLYCWLWMFICTFLVLFIQAFCLFGASDRITGSKDRDDIDKEDISGTHSIDGNEKLYNTNKLYVLSAVLILVTLCILDCFPFFCQIYGDGNNTLFPWYEGGVFVTLVVVLNILIIFLNIYLIIHAYYLKKDISFEEYKSLKLEEKRKEEEAKREKENNKCSGAIRSNGNSNMIFKGYNRFVFNNREYLLTSVKKAQLFKDPWRICFFMDNKEKVSIELVPSLCTEEGFRTYYKMLKNNNVNVDDYSFICYTDIDYLEKPTLDIEFGYSEHLLIFEREKKIVYKGRIVDFKDIFEVRIDNTNNGISTIVSSTDTDNLLARGIIGDVVAGPLGAAVGAATANRTYSSLPRIDFYIVTVVVNDLKHPIMQFICNNNLAIAQRIASTLSVIIQRMKNEKQI